MSIATRTRVLRQERQDPELAPADGTPPPFNEDAEQAERNTQLDPDGS